MQIESRIIVPFNEEAISKNSEFTKEPLDFAQPAQSQAIDESKESKIDVLSASVIYGLTGTFVFFLFGWVTEYIRLLENALLSSFIGVCVGVIAFALMKEGE